MPIGNLRETALHAALKAWYARPGDEWEAPVAGYFVDLRRGDVLIEIQTRNFSAIKRKLARLLDEYTVRLVHPVAQEKYIVREGKHQEAVRAYLACISFADAMIGRLLAALDRSPYAKNTVVVFFSDNGWHLGEKSHWRKFALWEETTRAPLIWVVPGLIDLHVHAFWGVIPLGLEPDPLCPAGGVTTMLDAGSAGFIHAPSLSQAAASQYFEKRTMGRVAKRPR